MEQYLKIITRLIKESTSQYTGPSPFIWKKGTRWHQHPIKGLGRKELVSNRGVVNGARYAASNCGTGASHPLKPTPFTTQMTLNKIYYHVSRTYEQPRVQTHIRTFRIAKKKKNGILKPLTAYFSSRYNFDPNLPKQNNTSFLISADIFTFNFWPHFESFIHCTRPIFYSVFLYILLAFKHVRPSHIHFWDARSTYCHFILFIFSTTYMIHIYIGAFYDLLTILYKIFHVLYDTIVIILSNFTSKINTSLQGFKSWSTRCWLFLKFRPTISC